MKSEVKTNPDVKIIKSITIDPDLSRVLTETAKANERSFSSELAHRVKRTLREDGILKDRGVKV